MPAIELGNEKSHSKISPHSSKAISESESLSYPPGFGPIQIMDQDTHKNVETMGYSLSCKSKEEQQKTLRTQKINRSSNGSKLEDGPAQIRKEGATDLRLASGDSERRCMYEQEEETHSTQPFWEGLASEDEILQSRTERLARKLRKKGKKIKRKTIIVAKELQCKQRIQKKPTSQRENEQSKQDLVNKATVDMRKKRSERQVAEEMRAIRQRLGLVEENDTEETIRRLMEMERRDRINIAQQELKKKTDGEEKGKRKLWEELLCLIKEYGGGCWCMGGDFNTVRGTDERKGRSYDATEAREFNKFIVEAGLEDIPMAGRKYTWYKSDGSAMSRDLKQWNKEIYGNIDKNIEAAREVIKTIDEKGETTDLTELEVEQRKEGSHHLWEWLKAKDSLLCQKSRQKWIKEGDANSKFFHGCVIKKRRQNGIDGLTINGEWIEDAGAVKHFIKEFFRRKFEEEQWNRPGLELNNLRRLSIEENAMLIATFSEEEIREAVMEARALLLANRMRCVMKSIINPNQSAFIEGRQIVDGIITTNELIHETKKRRRPTLIFKADFEKAYDSVNWEFLDVMLDKLGFCLLWRTWIQECLASASVSILVNGSPTEEFQMTKGLRQGDPLAPFLFLVVAEALNGLINKAVEEGLLEAATVGSGVVQISHLQFTDDTLIFCKASPDNAWAIKCIFRSFELISGLKVNFFKSSLSGIHVNDEDLSAMADMLNCMVGTIPFKYLGVPVGANSRKVSTWSPIVECLRKRLSSWRCETLSFGGRIILLNAVLSSIPVYYFSTLKGPKKVINLLSLIQRRFLWGGCEKKNKIAWVGWDHVCRTKNEGGLGVKNLGTFNLALLGKWRWRLLEEKEALWRRVVEAKYKVNRKNVWLGDKWDAECSGWWKDIWQLDVGLRGREGWFRKGVKKVVGEGNDTLFWYDRWLGEYPLKDKFNRLFRLSMKKDAIISDMGEWRNGEWCWHWSWRRNLFAWENALLQELKVMLQVRQLQQGQTDHWVWQHDSKRKYSVKSAYKILQDNLIPGKICNFKLIWNKW
ncbi:hypothetical protein SLEP1_g60039, partial [Rubroshorea leprosula]